nr:hypothetical protein [Sinorhizobium meliloti]
MKPRPKPDEFGLVSVKTPENIRRDVSTNPFVNVSWYTIREISPTQIIFVEMIQMATAGDTYCMPITHSKKPTKRRIAWTMRELLSESRQASVLIRRVVSPSAASSSAMHMMLRQTTISTDGSEAANSWSGIIEIVKHNEESAANNIACKNVRLFWLALDVPTTSYVARTLFGALGASPLIVLLSPDLLRWNTRRSVIVSSELEAR